MNSHHGLLHRLPLAALLAGLLANPARGQTFNFDGARGPGPSFQGGPRFNREAPVNGLPGRPVGYGGVDAFHEGDLDSGTRERWDGSRTKALAHELEENARALYSAYRQRSDTGNWWKKQLRAAALSALKDLVEDSEHFHRQVESRWQDPQHTREDFRKVLASLDRAEEALRTAYHGDRVNGELFRVQQTAGALMRYYRGRGAGGWRDWETVKQLAHTVDEKAEHAYEQMRRESHHGDYWEQRALQDLGAFSSKAKHFHRQLESFRQDPSHTRQDYWELVRAFNQAQGSLAHAHPTEHVRRDFAEAARALRDLDRYYRGGSPGGGHDDDHGRDHDHGGPWGR